MAIAVVQGSSRQNGHTAKIIDELSKHISIQKYDLLDYNISQYDYHNNNAGDDFIPLMEEVIEKHSQLIFATPIYWYTMSGIMKRFLDRWTDLVTIRKDLGRSMQGMRMSVLSCGSDDDLPSGFFAPFSLTAGYMDMVYLSEVHVWVDGVQLEEQVKHRLETFAKSLRDV